MAPLTNGKKRKAVTRDVETEAVAAAGGEFRDGDLNGILSDSEPDSHFSGSQSEEEFDSEADLEDEFDQDEEDEEEEDSEDEDIRLQIQALQTNGAAGGDAASDLADDMSPEPVDKRLDDLERNYTVTKDANGNPRFIYKEIDPVYDSDDTDAGEATNTIGNIPLSYYESYPHIGYDINGKKIMRPAAGQALDALLDSIEVPEGWTGLTDPETGKPLKLTEEQLQLLKKVTQNEMPGEGYDPYPDMVEYFSSHLEIMPLSAAPEPKRRFIPSKNEHKRIMKIVRAIREGRIQPYKAPAEREEEDPDIKSYDLWADEQPRPDHIMNIPAPKLPPPGYEESYHPPPEYVPDQKEKAAWEALDPEDREKDYLPTSYDALRKVPAFASTIKERFERCLDLYLAPRVRRSKLNIDPESLLPKLPSPEELRPFPSVCATIFRGHQGRVRSVSIDTAGNYLASGGDDGTVRIWDILTGRQVWSVKLSPEDAVDAVRWRPGTEEVVLTAAVQEQLYFIVPYGLASLNPETEEASRVAVDAGFGYQTTKATTSTEDANKTPPAKWTRPPQNLVEQGVILCTTVRSPIKVITWHRKGDYLSTVCPRGQSHAIAIHTLSKHLTQLPFRRLKGLAQTAQFHPSKPIFFVATQRTIRSYDLIAQQLVKQLQPGARWISSIDIHPGGDNLIVGSYDRRLLWHDLDLSNKPYKTLRYHTKAIRAVKYHHGGFPLFADASDDGSVQVFHGKVVGDLMENATIVPLKVLKGHSVKGQLGVLDLDWHPRHPWLVSAGADGTCRLWN